MERVKAGQQRQVWDANATASYPSMFQILQDQVSADVKESNLLYQSALSFTPNQDGFMVIDGNERVTVSRTPGTVIKIESHHSGVAKDSSDHIDIVADEAGAIRYRYRDKILNEVSDASELILNKFVPA